MRVQIEVPYAKRFDDYHEIDQHAEDINELVKETVKGFECGFNGFYYGIFYVGRRPSRTEMKKLVQRDCDLREDDDVNWAWSK